jgi:hypothetical protein
VEDGVEEDRAEVEADHREARPGERPVQPEQPLLPLRPEQAGAHRQTELDRQREQPERHQAGGAVDEPGGGYGGHAALTTSRSDTTFP